VPPTSATPDDLVMFIGYTAFSFLPSTYDYAKSVQRTMGELAEPDGQLSPLVGKPSANVFSAAALIAGCMIGGWKRIGRL
jgi:hypothetical protein